MFTGIVGGFYEVESLQPSQEGRRLILKVPKSFTKDAFIGCSIAVNGVCLTLVKEEELEAEQLLHFDIIEETCQKTNLLQLQKGSLVNLERSLSFGSEVGGHLLTGHVSTVAQIAHINRWNENLIMTFQVPKHFEEYLIEKTHIGIDGVSLTLVELASHDPKWTFFTTHLIPETMRQTTLPFKEEGDEVNIEFNQTLKTIVETTKRVLERKLSEGKLKV